MTTQYGPSQLEAMAWTIDHTGIGAIPAATLRALGFEANQSGVPTAVTSVLVDPSAPHVARDRAFGFVAAALSRSATRSVDVARAA